MDRYSFFLIILLVGAGNAIPLGAQTRDDQPGKESVSGQSARFEGGLRGILIPAPPPLPGEFYPRNSPQFLYPPSFTFQPLHAYRASPGTDLMMLWKQELARGKELETLRFILGTAVIGGAAYTAYQHIKKYGF